MRQLKQSTAYELMVFMTDSSDHLTGKTGLTLTITASKAGGAFASITPTVTERSNGWYDLSLTTSHTDTLGDLALHITGTGADPSDLVAQVRANILGDTLPANLTQSLGVAITNEDFTVASATSTTVTLPTTYSSGASLPDDGRYADTAVQVVSGTGAGEVFLLLKATGTARQYSVQSGSMPVQVDSTSKCVVLGPTAGWLLKHSIAVTATNSRTVAEAFAFLRNKWTSVGGTLTVYDTDDATSLWTSALSGDSSAQPIVSSDPA